MKNIALQIIFLSFSLIGIAQEEKSITVTGKSNIEIKAESMRLTLLVQEIDESKINNIKGRSIDGILQELDDSLKNIGHSILDLEEIFSINMQRPRNSKKYFLDVNNINEANIIKDLSITGLNIWSISYNYSDELNFDNYQLYEEVIKDARKKAELIADAVNKKIGKVISIVDNTKSNTVPLYSPYEKTSLEYSLIIKYELLEL